MPNPPTTPEVPDGDRSETIRIIGEAVALVSGIVLGIAGEARLDNHYVTVAGGILALAGVGALIMEERGWRSSERQNQENNNNAQG